jgi:hypothetical protein
MQINLFERSFVKLSTGIYNNAVKSGSFSLFDRFFDENLTKRREIVHIVTICAFFRRKFEEAIVYCPFS